MLNYGVSLHSYQDEPASSADIACVSLRQLLLLCCDYKNDRDTAMGPLACQSRGYFKLTQSRRLEEEEERGDCILPIQAWPSGRSPGPDMLQLQGQPQQPVASTHTNNAL